MPLRMDGSVRRDLEKTPGSDLRKAVDPDLEIRGLQTRLLLDRLEKDKADIGDCRAYLRVVEDNLRRLRWHYTAYDSVWEALHRIRHCLCLLAPGATELLDIARDVQGDLSYVPDARERQELAKQLDEICLSLRGANPWTSMDRAKLCVALREASVTAGTYRDSRWRRVNQQRNRLRWIAVTLTGALLASVALICWSGALGGGWRDALPLATVLGLGAVGGLVSSLRTLEAPPSSHEVLSSAEYEIQQLLLWIRPLVGATSALFVTLVYRAGIIDFNVGTGDRVLVSLTLAFVAGFSERLFVGQIDALTAKIAPMAEPTAGPAIPRASGAQTAARA